MPIIFEDYRRKRRVRRAWAVIAGLGVASTIAMLALSRQGETTDPARPSSVPTSTSAVAANASHSQPTYRKVETQAAGRANDIVQDRCTVVDGDTLRCGSERVRLIGIDAPELPGHCRQGRACVAGDPFAAADALRQRIAAGEVRIERMGLDRYGRTLASVYISGKNVACDLISRGHAQYVVRWDDGGRVAADCNVTL